MRACCQYGSYPARSVEYNAGGTTYVQYADLCADLSPIHVVPAYLPYAGAAASCLEGVESTVESNHGPTVIPPEKDIPAGSVARIVRTTMQL